MSSIFRSTMNTRPLPLGGGRFLRSDVPLHLAEDEVQWLLEQGVTTLVDLRSDEEVARKPCPLQNRDGFRYFHLPVTGGGDTPKSRAHLHETYRQMVDAQMDKILETILGAEGGVMYFCTAGKDRTGVVSAMLLHRLGVDKEIIVADYMLTKDNVMGRLLAYVQLHPEVDLNIIVPHEENIRRVLALL
jgi:protein-tyrosine phosphatase